MTLQSSKTTNGHDVCCLPCAAYIFNVCVCTVVMNVVALGAHCSAQFSKTIKGRGVSQHMHLRTVFVFYLTGAAHWSRDGGRSRETIN